MDSGAEAERRGGIRETRSERRACQSHEAYASAGGKREQGRQHAASEAYFDHTHCSSFDVEQGTCADCSHGRECRTPQRSRGAAFVPPRRGQPDPPEVGTDEQNADDSDNHLLPSLYRSSHKGIPTSSHLFQESCGQVPINTKECWDEGTGREEGSRAFLLKIRQRPASS